MAITSSHISGMINTVYARRQSAQAVPEGQYDSMGRFVPSAREGGGIRVGHWAFAACCALEHCTVLVQRALAGCDVPADVSAVVGTVRMAALARLVA